MDKWDGNDRRTRSPEQQALRMLVGDLMGRVGDFDSALSKVSTSIDDLKSIITEKIEKSVKKEMEIVHKDIQIFTLNQDIINNSLIERINQVEGAIKCQDVKIDDAIKKQDNKINDIDIIVKTMPGNRALRILAWTGTIFTGLVLTVGTLILTGIIKIPGGS
jgi:hypothetical protein